MEVLGLALAIPAVVVANTVYVLLVRFGLVRFKKLRPWVLWPSYIVVLLAIIDVVLVVTLGAVAARTLIGPAFWRFHLVVLVFGASSLANVLALTREGVWFRRWYATVAFCCLFDVFLVFFQVRVGGRAFWAGRCWRAILPVGAQPRLQPSAAGAIMSRRG